MLEFVQMYEPKRYRNKVKMVLVELIAYMLFYVLFFSEKSMEDCNAYMMGIMASSFLLFFGVFVSYVNEIWVGASKRKEYESFIRQRAIESNMKDYLFDLSFLIEQNWEYLTHAEREKILLLRHLIRDFYESGGAEREKISEQIMKSVAGLRDML